MTLFDMAGQRSVTRPISYNINDIVDPDDINDYDKSTAPLPSAEKHHRCNVYQYNFNGTHRTFLPSTRLCQRGGGIWAKPIQNFQENWLSRGLKV